MTLSPSVTTASEEEPGIRSQIAPVIALAAYAVVLLFAVSAHEMWRDELQAWSIAASSGSMADLFRRSAYEPDPNLWFVILYIASRISASPFTLQIVNFLIAVGTAALILFRAPLAFYQRVLLVFGYFMLYEYGAISRPYGLAILLGFGAVNSLSRDRRAIVVPSLLLVLMMQASMYGALLALPLAAIIVFRILTRGARAGQRVAGAVILLVGVLSVLSELRMPHDFSFPRDPGRGIRPLIAVADGFIPIVPWRIHFWNAPVIPAPVAAALGLMILLVSAATLFRSRPALFVYVSATAILLYATFAISYGGWRHHGLLMIAYVMALWLARARGERQGAERFLTVVLLVQVASSAVAVTNEYRFDFSAAKRTAAFIGQKGWQNDILVGYPDLQVSTIAGYLGRPFFYVNGGRSGTYVVWDDKRFLVNAKAFTALVDDARRHHRRVVLVTASGRQLRGDPFVQVAFFDQATVADETYRVYVSH
jgi:hypothetical protein